MDYEIDMDAVDRQVVGRMILVLCEAMLAADDIDPTVDECVVAFGKMIEMVIDDAVSEAPVH